ncbi:MAG: RluA family pseudouridine synthase [Chitinophagaceae bacterium]|nr:MAG: RluA family pseudouridine synthase [Chitinophagaceae bacterium]
MNDKPVDIEEDLSDAEELYEKLSIVIDRGQAPLRIDKFLMTRIEGATRNKIQQAIEEERVLVNEKPVRNNHKVKPGDRIVIFETNSPDSSEIIPQNIPLNIIYEDDDLMVINKPVGMVVHPGSGNPDNTLINAVAYYLKQQNPALDESVLPRFGLVHRIDKNTSGLLVMAKTQKAMTDLAKQFFNHTVHRRYVALVWGNFDEQEGTITGHVGRHQRFRKLFTLFNDDFYGGDRIVKGTVYTRYKQFVDNCFALCPRQALHAKELGFVHPTTREQMMFESEMPEDISQVVEKWRKYSQFKNEE